MLWIILRRREKLCFIFESMHMKFWNVFIIFKGDDNQVIQQCDIKCVYYRMLSLILPVKLRVNR